MGRPPKRPEERQRHTLAVRLTDAEYEEIEEAAEGKPLGAFIRRIVVRYLARRRK
jgi:hypothetical protein